MRALLVLLILLAACDHDDVTAPCEQWTTITQRGLHADTAVSTCVR